jgi:spermidine synthase
MTDTVPDAGARLRGRGLYALASFFSAALVFLVEPMIAQLLLPRLGGSPSVWDTSLAFFQLALLAGYGYAHLLQKVAPPRWQWRIHLGVLVLAAAALPLRLSGLPAEGATAHPILWLLVALTLSIGAPFAALSATAPLLQAWLARTPDARRNPYSLYVASNLGSLLALMAYPFAVQPVIGLGLQARLWTGGYLIFVLAVLALGLARRLPADGPANASKDGEPALWRDRVAWILLAAAPSSLLLGVTSHITSDVASVPFLWIPPLALYLLAFVVAFQDRPLIPPRVVLVLQALAAPICLWLTSVRTQHWLPLVVLHLATFFLTALMCSQALAARRPQPRRLTDFYLCLALGGVIGGAFNAFLAPVIFDDVWEYPAVLALAALARPSSGRPAYPMTIALLIGGLGAELMLASPDVQIASAVEIVLVGAVCTAAFLLRGRPAAFAVLAGGLAIAGVVEHRLYDVSESHRSFFGVVQIGEADAPELGAVRYMMHGSTIHGAEAVDPALRCRPLAYYAPAGPIGQAFASVQTRKPAARLGVVGLGTGTVAAFVRPSDSMTVFEIDPMVVRLATDPARFDYVKGCAKGPVSMVIGDARQSLQREPGRQFDLLLVDAFSSDSIPTHLLTRQAMALYLRVIKPDGVVVLHLSNRNLELVSPAAAAIQAAGGVALTQTHQPPPGTPMFDDAGAIVVLAARSPAALKPFAQDPRWRPADPTRARAWTDDYANVLGALVRRIEGQP